MLKTGVIWSIWFLKKYLSKNGKTPKQYNQVANLVYTEQATNIKVGMLPPIEYTSKVLNQINNNVFDISTIDSKSGLDGNFESNDIPKMLYTATDLDYNDFLIERRRLIAIKIRNFYERL